MGCQYRRSAGSAEAFQIYSIITYTIRQLLVYPGLDYILQGRRERAISTSPIRPAGPENEDNFDGRDRFELADAHRNDSDQTISSYADSDVL